MKNSLLFFLLVGISHAQFVSTGVSIINDTLQPVTFEVMRYDTVDESLTLVNTYTIPPTETLEFTLTLFYPSPGTQHGIFRVQDPNYTLEANSYIRTTGPSTYTTLETLIPDPGVPFIGYLVSNWDVPLGRTSTPDNAKTVWELGDLELTGDLFREGIDKLVAKPAPTSPGGMTPEQYALTKTEAVAEAIEAANLANPTPEDMSTAAATYKTSMDSAVSDVLLPSIGTATPPSASSSLIMVVGSGSYQFTLDMDPAHDPDMSEFMGFLKTVTGWALLLAFSWWTWAEFKDLAFTAVGMTQAKGNAVVGGTGAQATSLLAAGLISAIFIGIPAAYWAWQTLDLTDLNSNPFSSSSGGYVTTGLYLLHMVFPYPLLLLIIAQMFIIRKAGVTILLGANVLIKFIVP